MPAPSQISIVVPPALYDGAGAVAWAAEDLVRALGARDIRAQIVETAASGAAIVVSGPAAPGGAGGDLPHEAEALSLVRTGERIEAWGADTRGIVYGLTELADRARTTSGDDPFEGMFPLVERPSARIRSISRLFSAETEDKLWFYDRQHWREYFAMLATNRINRFSLALGFGYNYPYHNPWITDVYFYFPYPFLLDLPGFGVTVRELPPEERALNLETLQFIGAEAARHGLDFQLALWTQRYDFDDVPRGNYTVAGVTDDNLAPYCRQAITTLLQAVPQITGLTFRVHVEGGIAEGDYAFWEEAFAGVADAGRPVEIDMHGKGLDWTAIDIARRSGMPITASPKYLAEHMGLPYHQSAIREKEYPPERPRSEREQLSEGSRKFLRYSYGDLLRKEKDFKVLYRIWPGTQRLLLWGDPVFAAGYGRSSMFAGSDGVEWCEPLSFKGRMGTGVPGQRFSYQKQGWASRHDWQKYDYQYRVWGRLLYNPEAPRQSWMRWLERECGAAAEACEAAMSLASRVLPLVALAHGPSASNNFYWPEIYTNLGLFEGAGKRAYGSDMEGATRFGNAPTFDSMLFANPRELAQDLLGGRTPDRYGPLEVASWLTALADGCDGAIASARSLADGTRPEARRMLADAGILSGLARYFAHKMRASCWAELHIATKASRLVAPMIAEAERAVAAWRGIAELSRGLYPDDITFGPQSWLRGSWHTRLPEIEAELLDLEALRNFAGTESVEAAPDLVKAVDLLERGATTVSERASIEAPSRFVAGEDLVVTIATTCDAAPILHYRHVNQAERWQQAEMARAEQGYRAVIPGAYTASDYHLQYFITFRRDGNAVIAPGLDADLANEPYLTSIQT